MSTFLTSPVQQEDLSLEPPLPMIEKYLRNVLSDFSFPIIQKCAADHVTAEQIHDILTDRSFCYLSKAKVAPYREKNLRVIENAIHSKTPIPFSYDIGGGYHASYRIGSPINFNIGLAELLLLRQISLFAQRISAIYAPGVTFLLVIDNLCALLSNEISLEKTCAYCTALRELIRSLGMESFVEILVESECVTLKDFLKAVSSEDVPTRTQELSEKEYVNVLRFMDGICGREEALLRKARYACVLNASERVLAPFIKGIHMTQRATPSTVCFRPFPGADSRIQCGEVVLAQRDEQKIYPMLLTTNNAGKYICSQCYIPFLAPYKIPSVAYAKTCFEVLGEMEAATR